MIDGHVHAFPSLATAATRAARRTLGDGAARAVEEKILPAVRAAQGHARRALAPLLPEEPLLGIEQVAALQRKTGGAHGWIERVSSLVLSPPAMIGGTVDGLLASMDRHGIETSILIGARGVASNEWLLGEAVARGGDRVVPVVTLPELPEGTPARAWHDEYERLAAAGARGFKIHSNWDGIGASHPAVRAIFEVASARGLFVILHTGCFHVLGYKTTRPVDLSTFEPFFVAYPRVRVCLAHMNREHPEEAWFQMKRFEHVFADTSWQTSESIARAVDAVGSERIMLGSDWPLLHMDLQGDAVARADRALRGTALDDVLERSAKRFLGDRPRPAATTEASARP
jgi:predicted TIM-barrel fold metal-dependent hydrolase